MFNVERSGEETRKLSHNNDRCVGCGICTDVCPTSSLRLGPIVPIARGLIEMDLVSVTSNTCVLCGLCSVACPFDALSLTINGNDIKETGNIFKDYCSEFSEEAKIIASWTNSKSANAGPCELLLKFIIKEANSKKTGDVTIHNDEEMEVKASTLKGKSSGSGGHAAGQRGKIRNTWAVYYYLNNNVFNIETSNSEADKLKYFQNKDGVQELNNVIKDKGLSIEEVTNGIVDALCFQYNFITNENDVKNELKTKDKLYKAALNIAKSISKNNEFNSSNDVFNLVGCIQLYLYSQIEGFDYFFAVLVDKNIDNESDNNGFYFCVKNCQDDNSELLNFDKILSYIRFGGLDSTTSSQGRTGKIYIKKN